MGLMPNVVADELIESAWGNQIRDRTWQTFQNKAELLAQWPTAPNGMHAWTIDERAEWVRYAGAWSPAPSFVTGHQGTALIGAFDAAKPVKVLTARVSGVGDANGLVTVPFPAGTTAILSGIVTPITGATGNIHVILRTDLGSVTVLNLQARRNTDGTAVANAVFLHSFVGHYQ